MEKGVKLRKIYSTIKISDAHHIIRIFILCTTYKLVHLFEKYYKC